LRILQDILPWFVFSDGRISGGGNENHTRGLSMLPPADKFIDERFQPGDRLNFEDAISPDIVLWWDERFGKPFGLSPRSLCDKISDGLPGETIYTYMVIDPVREVVRLAVTSGDDVEYIWLTGHSIEFEKNKMENDYTEFVPHLQGDGLGKTLMSNVFDLADLMGLDRLAVNASKDAGPYAWARFGFAPDQAEWESNVRPTVTSKLHELRAFLPNDLHTEISSLLQRGDGTVIWEIARQRYPVPSCKHMAEDGVTPLEIPLGRALLAESGAVWYGELDLNDEAAVAIFLEYVGGQV
jgi:GNAT superfamily N-acetyltransferase